MQPQPKDEHDPVTDDEFILRRIPKTQYTAGHPDPVARVAFQPGVNDHDGGSFNREHFVAAEQLALTGRKPGDYYIARFSVAQLRGPDFRLTIDPSPEPKPDRPRGHCVIRELSIEAHNADMARSKELQRKLAKLAGKNIVYVPVGCTI